MLKFLIASAHLGRTPQEWDEYRFVALAFGGKPGFPILSPSEFELSCRHGEVTEPLRTVEVSAFQENLAEHEFVRVSDSKTSFVIPSSRNLDLPFTNRRRRSFQHPPRSL